MITITVKNSNDGCNLRDDLSFKDAFNVDATFSMTKGEDGHEIGDIDDLVAMFIKAAELEGYATKSIANSLYAHALLEAYENNFIIEGEEGDEKLICNGRSSR